MKRNKFTDKMKAACLAAVMCVSTLPVLTAQIQPVTAYAQEKTGTVNAGVTGLRIRSSTDTSSTANVITKVSGGFHLIFWIRCRRVIPTRGIRWVLFKRYLHQRLCDE